METRENILICPLNWGLGHASRCIPVIESIEENNFNVIIAASGNAYSFLKKTFPHLTIIWFEDYNIRFPKGNKMVSKIVWQFPRILYRIFLEHQKLKKLAREYKLSMVVSDNRFGLWNKNLVSIYITHQINIKSPNNNEVVEKLLHWLHLLFIKKYTECWVPDNVGDFKLAGQLSSKYELPKNARYMGLLSRFTNPKNEVPAIYDVCVILSGSEPQRSIFEKIVMQQLTQSALKAVVFLGKPNEDIYELIDERIHVYSFLPTVEMQDYILKSAYVLSRAGYTTLMDLATLDKKAILVPTPGQTEQEYLAQYLSEENIFYSTSQDNFDLMDALDKVKNTVGIYNVTS